MRLHWLISIFLATGITHGWADSPRFSVTNFDTDWEFIRVDPMAVHDIQEIILSLKKKGLGVLITDHNVRETLSVVDRAYIIDEGRVLSEGTREFLLNDPIAREIYLGHRFSM